MRKSDAIEAITELNRSAQPNFLAEFSHDDLERYLGRLRDSISREPACKALEARFDAPWPFAEDELPDH